MDLRTLTVPEAADQTGMSQKTIRRLLADGAIAGNRVGTSYRVSVASLEAWVNRTPGAPAPTMAARAFPEVVNRFNA